MWWWLHGRSAAKCNTDCTGTVAADSARASLATCSRHDALAQCCQPHACRHCTDCIATTTQSPPTLWHSSPGAAGCCW